MLLFAYRFNIKSNGENINRQDVGMPAVILGLPARKYFISSAANARYLRNKG
jgi:hypothetical protein